ncbi:hypothetical protein THAOC_19549, partial [Thalassiosira oceanica]
PLFEARSPARAACLVYRRGRGQGACPGCHYGDRSCLTRHTSPFKLAARTSSRTRTLLERLARVRVEAAADDNDPTAPAFSCGPLSAKIERSGKRQPWTLDPQPMTMAFGFTTAAMKIAELPEGQLQATDSSRGLVQKAVGNMKSKLMDAFIPAAASSDLQIRTRTGSQPTEVPSRCRRGAAEEPNTDIGPEGGVDGP